MDARAKPAWGSRTTTRSRTVTTATTAPRSPSSSFVPPWASAPPICPRRHHAVPFLLSRDLYEPIGLFDLEDLAPRRGQPGGAARLRRAPRGRAHPRLRRASIRRCGYAHPCQVVGRGRRAPTIRWSRSQRTMSHDDLSPETQAVHAGVGRYEHRPVVPPIYQTSTFAFDNVEQGAALFAGGRRATSTPAWATRPSTRSRTRSRRSRAATAASPAAAGWRRSTRRSPRCSSAGDHVVCSEAVYGPTCTLVETAPRRVRHRGHVRRHVGLRRGRRRRCGPNTKVVFVETPGNPTLVVSDLEAMADIAHEHGAQLVVDNTFMSPILQRPLELGADVVVHSLTKFLNGHADVVGGVIVAKDEEHYARFRKVAEPPRRRAAALRVVPGPPRHQDAGAPHGAPQPSRPSRSPGTSRPTPPWSGCAIPGLESHPAARDPPPADRRRRRHDQLRAQGRRRGRSAP